MKSHLDRLLEISSQPLLDQLSATDRLRLPQSLIALYERRNGLFAFESALHVFPVGKRSGVMDLDTWNSPGLWRDEYGALVRDDWLFFSEDIFGGQFLVTGAGEIGTFDPETALVERFAADIEEWADKLLDDYKVVTGQPLAHEWQVVNGPLVSGQRLLPTIPFAMQGEFAVSNLYAGEAVKGMRFRGSLARQIKDLPPGATVSLKVVD